MVFVVLQHHFNNDSKILATSFDEEHAKQQAYGHLELGLMQSYDYQEKYWTPEEVTKNDIGQRCGTFKLMVDGAESGIEIQSWSTPLAG